MSTDEPITLDRALDVAMQLSREHQEMLIQVLRSRQIEQRREETEDTIVILIDIGTHDEVY